MVHGLIACFHAPHRFPPPHLFAACIPRSGQKDSKRMSSQAVQDPSAVGSSVQGVLIVMVPGLYAGERSRAPNEIPPCLHHRGSERQPLRSRSSPRQTPSNGPFLKQSIPRTLRGTGRLPGFEDLADAANPATGTGILETALG